MTNASELDSQGVLLTVAVTAHAEGRLLRPTLRSIAAAVQEVVDAGTSCELLLILDNATDSTKAEAEHWLRAGAVPAQVRLLEVSFGDAGSSRNAGARHARGKFLAYCDGDDLVTKDYLSKGMRLLEGETERVILHPSLVMSFGARSAIWEIPSTDDVDHLGLIRDNLWPSSSMSQRSTYLDFPYSNFSPEDGIGPEDWLWNIETTVAQIPHRPIPGTMFFYRVREFGGVNNRHMRSILPAFDLNGLVRAMPARADAPGVANGTAIRRDLRWFLRAGYRVARPAIRVLLGFLNQRSKEALYGWALSAYRRSNRSGVKPQVPHEVIEALRAAAELEPAISWTANAFADLPKWQPNSDGYSELLVSLVDQLRAESDAIVAVPWVGIGGADLVSLNYARALAETDEFKGKVSMLATYTASRTLRHLVPENVNFVQVPELFRVLSPDMQRRLLAQVVLFLKPRLLVSVNCFDVTNSLQLYGRQMGSSSRIYLTLFAFDRIGDGYPVNPITDDGQRSYLDDIAGIITDNTVTAEIVSNMLAISETQIRVHRQPAMDPIPDFRPGTRAFNNRFFSDDNPFMLLWPHRLDKEKRPDSLVEIAKRLRSMGLPVSIEVFGQQVLSGGGRRLMESLSDAGVVYRGPYSGGLPSIPTENYHALLLTSESEGLPLVLVQSMLLGLPVIATAVGGVSDIVRDNETGMLVDSPDDVEGFVSAIEYLMKSFEERRRIIRSAYDFASAEHSWSTFAGHVLEI